MRPAYIRLLVGLLLTFILAVLAGLVFARLSAGGGVAMYPFYAPDSDSLSYLYADVNRSLMVVKAAPAHVLIFYNPTISPDQKLRVRSIPSEAGSPEIFIVANGRVITQLTYPGRPSLARGLNSRSNILPAWSPDGAWILFVSTGTGRRFELFAIRPNGDDLRLLNEGVAIGTILRARWVQVN